MEFLQKISNMFSGINIQTKVLLLSFVVTVVLGLIIIPILKKLKIGQVVREDGPKEHLKKSGTPTMGRNYYADCSNGCIFNSISQISRYNSCNITYSRIWFGWSNR